MSNLTRWRVKRFLLLIAASTVAAVIGATLLYLTFVLRFAGTPITDSTAWLVPLANVLKTPSGFAAAFGMLYVGSYYAINSRVTLYPPKADMPN